MNKRILSSEILLSMNARPRFKNHKLPNVYCLGDKHTTLWDDSNPEAIGKQIDLAVKYGIDFFIFDTYMGKRNNKFIQEMHFPLEKAFLKSKIKNKIKFAVMIIPESPRVILPIPGGYLEDNRTYDLDLETAVHIVNTCYKKYWKDKNYFTINGMPYLSFYISELSINKGKTKYIKTLIKEIRTYSKARYNCNLYIVGVASNTKSAAIFKKAGVNALTGYANLPDFDKNAPPIQDYNSQLEKQKNMWNIMGDKKIPFIPPAVTGWDSTPRGEQKIPFSSVLGQYPFTPLIINGSPKLFNKMLIASYEFVKKNINNVEEQYMIICAWNEVAESMSLLPTIKNGKTDFSYLEAVKKFKEKINL